MKNSRLNSVCEISGIMEGKHEAYLFEFKTF